MTRGVIQSSYDYMLDATTVRRFWEKVDRKGENECWIWRGGKSGSSGYGSLMVYSWKGEQRHANAHRISYCIKYGKVSEGKLLRHTCHNRACVNPYHLVEGTFRDNYDDMVAAGRKKSLKGIRKSKNLTRDQVHLIRRLHSEGKSYPEISELTGIKTQVVAHAARGETYADDVLNRVLPEIQEALK